MRFFVAMEELADDRVQGLVGPARDIAYALDQTIEARERRAGRSPYRTVLQFEGGVNDLRDIRSRLLECGFLSYLSQPIGQAGIEVIPSDRLYRFGPVSRALIADVLARGTAWTGEDAESLGLVPKAVRAARRETRLAGRVKLRRRGA